MMYIFLFFFFLGPCIPAGHFVFTWIVQTLVIVYTGSVYGYVFMAMAICLDVDSRVCMGMFVYGCVSGYVFGVMCMDIGSRSSARPGSINIGAYLSLGPVFIIIGTYSFTRPVSINIGTYSFTRPISANPGSYSFTRPISSLSGLTSSRGPFQRNLWVLLLHEAHLDDSPDFSNFS
jgi:hypothetical protein